jgi:hypothetical protein
MIQNTLIFLGIVLVVKLVVKELSKDSNIKESDALDDYKVNDTKDTIETGYPTPSMKALHINSTIKPPVPNHYFTDDTVSRFEEDDDGRSNKSICTVNMYVESFHELNLSLFGSDLTTEMVNNAYEKLLNEHIANIRNGVPELFNIEDKKKARDYLLGTLSKERDC